MIVVIDKYIPYAAEVLSRFAEVVTLSGEQISAPDVRDADALLIRTRTRCNVALLEGSRLKFVGTATIGYDHVDRRYCALHGIEFASAAGCNARAVLQWVGGVLACLSANEGWQPEERTLGVVGVGHVGRLVADYARSWGFRVLCSDPPREKAEHLGAAEGFFPLEQIAAEADIVTFHPLLTRDGASPSFHLADRRFFDALHDGATVLNASRGEVVDTAAAVDALGRLNFCIDTWENEPNLCAELLRAAMVATPHIAGYSIQGKANAAAAVVSALGHYFGIEELVDWYPECVAKSVPRPITWDEMCRTIGSYFDPAAETERLRRNTARFESLRNEYHLREEYF